MPRLPEKEEAINPEPVEVEVNLSLINSKLNFIMGRINHLELTISKIQGISQD